MGSPEKQQDSICVINPNRCLKEGLSCSSDSHKKQKERNQDNHELRLKIQIIQCNMFLCDEGTSVLPKSLTVRSLNCLGNPLPVQSFASLLLFDICILVCMYLMLSMLKRLRFSLLYLAV